jgi:pimeloyl-ACP methyl ester carboxylesterase
MKVRANGIEIEVEVDEASPSNERDPLVLVMGIGAQLVHWPDGFLDALRGAGFRLVRLDNRDVGLSTNLRHLAVPDPRKVMMRALLGLSVEAPYSLTDMADDIVGVLDALGIARAHMLGASMGGMIAQTFALRHPERLASLVSVMSSPGDRRFAVRAEPRAMKALLGPLPRNREETVARMLNIYRVIGSRTHPPDEAIVRLIGERSYDRGANPAGFARHFAAIAAAGSRRRALSAVTSPTLVIHGSQDPLIHVSAGRATAQAIPNARMLELGDMGHDLPRPLWGAITGAVRSIADAAR